jgi:acyl-CoA synthetase (AMP-forming)/AMP-acid ligase II
MGRGGARHRHPEGGPRSDRRGIIAHCRREIAHYKCPRSVEFRTKPFPLSDAGKVLKRELRAPYWERHAAGQLRTQVPSPLAGEGLKAYQPSA